MAKIPECDRCLFYAHHYLLVCAVHPCGPSDDFCPDYTPDPEVAGKKFVDFLGLEWTAGEQLTDLEAPIDNPFDFDSEENWAPEGTHFENGELVMEGEGGSTTVILSRNLANVGHLSCNGGNPVGIFCRC